MSTAPARSYGQRSTPRRLVAVLVISDLEFGGAQRQVIELANRLDAQDVDVYVCSLSNYVPLSRFLKHDERLRIIRRHVRFDVSVVFRLAWFLRKVRADVVHAFLFDAEIASRLAAQLAGAPAVICSERNTDYKSKESDLLALRLTRSLQDLVIANSESGARFNSALIGFPRERYRVIRNGVDVQRFSPQPSRKMKDSLGIPSDALVVGMFASFKPQKNHGEFLDAAREIIERTQSVRFLFVGDALYRGMSESDVYKQEISTQVDKLGLRDYCIFAGNRPDVEQIYPVCDVTVLPSLFEGTPNVLLESMACGVPVVATDVSDNRQIVPDGDVGFIVPSQNVQALSQKILELLENKELRERMSRQARLWAVQQFSNERLATTTARVYREAIASKKSSSNGCRDKPERQ